MHWQAARNMAQCTVSKHVNNLHVAHNIPQQSCMAALAGCWRPTSLTCSVSLSSTQPCTTAAQSTNPCHIVAKATLRMYKPNSTSQVCLQLHIQACKLYSTSCSLCRAAFTPYSLIMPRSIILSTESCSTVSSGVNFSPSSRTERLLSTGPTLTTSVVPSLYLVGRRRLG